MHGHFDLLSGSLSWQGTKDLPTPQNETPFSENAGVHGQSQTNVKVLFSTPRGISFVAEEVLVDHETEKPLMLEAGLCSL